MECDQEIQQCETVLEGLRGEGNGFGVDRKDFTDK